jgi:hypothetical protein
VAGFWNLNYSDRWGNNHEDLPSGTYLQEGSSFEWYINASPSHGAPTICGHYNGTIAEDGSLLLTEDCVAEDPSCQQITFTGNLTTPSHMEGTVSSPDGYYNGAWSADRM